MGLLGKDHSRAPLLEALQAFRARGDVPFAPPGHRQGRFVDPRVLAILGHGVFASDVLTLNELDDRRQSQGVLTQAEELMADAVGAEQAFFATCGSSLSVKTTMMTVAGPGKKLLVSRNAHKSVVSGLILCGIEPVWVHPHFDDALHLAHPPEPEDVQRQLDQHPDATGMLLITPTDWGTCADIKGVAEVCHAAGVPLIVDEAWGAHFPFHDQLPTWGMQAGADLVVTSVHKMGGAVEQSSVYHLQGDRIDPTELSQRQGLLDTTSPSTLVYASLDGWRRYMVEHGKQLYDDTLHRVRGLRDRLDALDGVDLLGDNALGPGKAYEQDPSKVVLDVRRLEISGYQAAEWLRTNCHVDVGSADTIRIEASFTPGDTDETALTFLRAIEGLIEQADTLDKSLPQVQLPPSGALELEQAMRPRDAFFGDTEQIPIEQAVGRIGAELVSPYPPGVPVVAPGEIINQEVIDYLRSGPPAGMVVPDAADSEMKTLKVVAR
jgi:arginine/lysine/ornithine decarboxylase